MSQNEFKSLNVLATNVGIFPRKKVKKGVGIVKDKNDNPIYLPEKELAATIEKSQAELIKKELPEFYDDLVFYNEEKDIYYFTVKAKNKLDIYDTTKEKVKSFEQLNLPIKEKDNEKAIEFKYQKDAEATINIVRLYNEKEDTVYMRLNAIMVDMLYIENPLFEFEADNNPFK